MIRVEGIQRVTLEIIGFSSRFKISVIIVNIIGVSLIEVTWDACYLVAVEIFPTHIRSIGIGTCSLLARIGALLAPQVISISSCLLKRFQFAHHSFIMFSLLILLCSKFFFFEIQMAYLSNIYKWLPYSVVCGIGFLSLIISFLFLPDTKGVNLDDVQKAQLSKKVTTLSDVKNNSSRL